LRSRVLSSKSELRKSGVCAAVTALAAVLAGVSSAASVEEFAPTSRAPAASFRSPVWFPSSPSPRDRAHVILAIDQSCDQPRSSRSQLRALLTAALTETAWREGRLAVAGFRADAIRTLGFDSVSFRSKFTQPEIVLRDLKRQRDAVRIDSLVRHVESARRGRCATDLFEVLRAIQEQSRISPGRPVLVVLLTNGIVAARGFDFCQAQPKPSRLVSSLRRQGLVFSLRGARVVFLGLGRTAEEDCVGSRKLDFLTDFWNAYAVASSFQVRFLSDPAALLDYWRSR
jgi:hypothetical protein